MLDGLAVRQLGVGVAQLRNARANIHGAALAIAQVELNLALGDGLAIRALDEGLQDDLPFAAGDLKVGRGLVELGLRIAQGHRGAGEGLAGGIRGAVDRVSNVGPGEHGEGVVPVLLAGGAGTGASCTQAGHDLRSDRGGGGDVEGDPWQAEGLVLVHRQARAVPIQQPTIALLASVIHRVRAVPDAGESAIGIWLAGGVNALHHGGRVRIQPGCAAIEAQVADLHALRQRDIVLHPPRGLFAGAHLTRLDLDGEGLAREHGLRVLDGDIIGGERQV